MKCKHEKVCTECVKAEIAKLREKIAELEKKLPTPQTVIINHYSQPWIQYIPQYVPTPVPMYTTPVPYYGPTVSWNTATCGGMTQSTLSANYTQLQ